MSIRDLWEHPRALHVAAAAVLGVVFALAWFGASLLLRVPRNCEAINAVNSRLDELVAFSTQESPAVHVTDPAVQALIDAGRERNAEFKALDARLSKKARCKP